MTDYVLFDMHVTFSLLLQLWMERLRGSIPYNDPRHGEGHVFCCAGGEDGHSLSCWAWKNRLVFIRACMQSQNACIILLY